MEKIGTLLFDMDGTFVESWTALYKAIAYTQEKLDFPVNSYEEVIASISKGLQNFWSRVLHSVDMAVNIERERPRGFIPAR